MTKTEAMIGNLKLKECDSILEFLFSDFAAPKSLRGKEKDRAKTRVDGTEAKNTLLSDTAREDVKLKIRASICHEIKNPLNCIISYAELLCKNSGTLQEELKRYVENIKISSMQLKALISDIIENAKTEYGKITLKKQGFETSRTIKDVSEAFSVQFKEKNITVRSALIRANVVSDLTKFNQILYNLISNAVKYTNKNGEISIVSWVQEDKFYFEIKNTGGFIKKNEAKRIFRLFQRVKRKEIQDKEGFGIGLCVSKELTELLNGELEFESTRKRTVFRFWIPLK